jgi:hypothetical protein
MRVLIVLFATCAFLIGCATQHESTESTVSANAGKIESLVVFSITDPQSDRVVVEDAFSEAMTAAGIPTRATYPYLAELVQLEDDAAIIGMYKKTGANMGLLIEVIEGHNEKLVISRNALFATYIAGLVLGDPTLRRVGAYGGVAVASQSGKYKLRLSLWDAETAELQWSMDTASFSNANLKKDATSLAERTRVELIKAGLIE